MAEVSLSINGKNYGMACDDGQEERVRALGDYVDERLQEIAGSGAATGEAHKLVLTALVLADEVFEMREHLQGLIYQQEQQKIHGAQSEGIAPDEEQLIAQAIQSLAQRLDSIAGRVRQA